jgi:hypothetical protein
MDLEENHGPQLKLSEHRRTGLGTGVWP